jgi:hypothetical protein
MSSGSYGWVTTRSFIMLRIHKLSSSFVPSSDIYNRLPEPTWRCSPAKPINFYFCSSTIRSTSGEKQQFTGCIVYVGVKFVNKFATVALLCVIFSIIAVYTGIFTNIHGNDNLTWVSLCDSIFIVAAGDVVELSRLLFLRGFDGIHF